MKRYFFDLQNGDGLTKDDEGQELGSRADVTRELTRILLDVAQDDMKGDDNTRISVTVRDYNGAIVSKARLTFSNTWTCQPE